MLIQLKQLFHPVEISKISHSTQIGGQFPSRNGCKMETQQTVLLLLIAAMSSVDGYRILVLFYHPGPSHFSAFYPLFNALAMRGHEVTVLTYSHAKYSHPNYHELLLDGMSEINSSINYDTMVSVVVFRLPTGEKPLSALVIWPR